MNKPIIFSFFSGSGFLDLGFEKAGYNIVYVNEINPPFLRAYKFSREKLNLSLPKYGYFEGDMSRLLKWKDQYSYFTDLKTKALKKNELVGFIGGPPCPDFSVGGKNKGAKGDHGKLTATYINLICQQKPPFFVFENVKGLWRTKKHRAFYELMKYQLHRAGYILTERVVNSLEVGVPQQRERIILIGFRSELIEKLGYPIDSEVLPDGIFPWESYIKYPIDKVLACKWPTEDKFKEKSILAAPKNIIEELTVEYWFNKNDVKNHPNADMWFTPRQGRDKMEVIAEGDESGKSFKRLHRWRFAPTAAYGNNEVHLHPYEIRRLSVAEVLSIQSLPKEFILPQDMTLSDAFKTVGNGVPYLLSLNIAKTLRDFLTGNSNISECRNQSLQQIFSVK